MRAWMWGVAIAALTLGRAAHARPSPSAPPGMTVSSPEAQQHMDAGIKWYNLANYPNAIREFQAGYMVASDPVFLFLVAQTYRKSGDCKDALTSYQAFLTANPDPRLADTARKAEAECEARSARSPVVAPHASSSASVAPVPLAAVSGSSHRSWTLPLVAGGTTLGLLAGGIGFALAGQSQDSALHSLAMRTPGQAASEESSARTDYLVADVLFAARALAAGATAYLVLRAPPKESEASTAVSVAPLPGGGAVTLSGRWW